MSPAHRIKGLTEDHNVDGFDCGDEDINEFLKEWALKYNSLKYARTYVMVNEENGDIIAYATVLNGVVELTDLDTTDFPCFPYPRMPAVLLARVGRDTEYRGKGLGKEMILYCIGLAHDLSESVGCRLAVVDSYTDRVKLYEDLGFVRCSEEEPEEDGERKTVKLYYDLVVEA